MPQLDWSQEALDELWTLRDRQPQQAEAIRQKSREFRRSGAGDLKKLHGASDEWRLRVGEWRVLMRKRDDGSYYVERISNRRDAHDR